MTGVAPGDRVGMSFNSCGGCPTCLSGRSTYCHDFFGRNFASVRPDGTSALSRNGELVHAHFFGQSSFATHAVANARNVVTLPEDVGFELAAPFGCGIQTGAGAVLNVMRPPPGSSLAVHGTGAVGLSAVMAGVIAGCTTIVGVDIRPGRLEIARDLGATHVVDAREADIAEEIRRATGGGADFAIETTGVPAVLRAAVDSLAPTGECGVIGAPPSAPTSPSTSTACSPSAVSSAASSRVRPSPSSSSPCSLELWRLGPVPGRPDDGVLRLRPDQRGCPRRRGGHDDQARPPHVTPLAPDPAQEVPT